MGLGLAPLSLGGGGGGVYLNFGDLERCIFQCILIDQGKNFGHDRTSPFNFWFILEFISYICFYQAKFSETNRKGNFFLLVAFNFMVT